MSSRSGSTPTSAPSAAAARVSRPAEARVRSVSVLACSWTAAALIAPPERLTDQSIWSVLAGHARSPRARRRRAGAGPETPTAPHGALPRGPPAQALALRGGLPPRRHALHRRRARGGNPAALVGRGAARRDARRGQRRDPRRPRRRDARGGDRAADARGRGRGRG